MSTLLAGKPMARFGGTSIARHETGGMIGCVLIAMHAAAALFHHRVVRAKTLRRMHAN